MKYIHTWTDLPQFDNEKDEASYWAAHQIHGRLMQSSLHHPNVRESTTITLRFDPRMLSRIKRVARRRFLNYQSMIKQWLSERMETEMKD